MSAYRIVRGIGMTWVRAYTAGLPRDARERRIGEIESDLWEQHLAADLRDASAIGGRFARGIPADIAWRIERSMHLETSDELVSTWHGALAALLVVAIAATSLVYAVLHTFGYFGADHQVYAFAQVGLLIASLVLLRGLSMTRESPRAGGAIVLVVGLGMAFTWAFMPPIAIVLLAVTAYGSIRAWSAYRGGDADLNIAPEWVLALLAVVALSIFLALGIVLIPLAVALGVLVTYAALRGWRVVHHRGRVSASPERPPPTRT